MADDSKDWGESKLRVEEMPISVQKLVDAMLSIDPHFSIESWLEEKAIEDLNLIKSDINREKIQLEQRLYRLQNIVNKLDPVDIREVPNDKLICSIVSTYPNLSSTSVKELTIRIMRSRTLQAPSSTYFQMMTAMTLCLQ